MGSDNSGEVLADQLREIASYLETGSTHCRVWADLKGHNRHCERLAAPLVYESLKLHWYGGSSLSGTLAIIADPRYGTINWRAIRTKLAIHTLRWLDEYDQRDAPPKRSLLLSATRPSEWNELMGYEDLAEPEDFQWKGSRHVKEDRTADELRQWYKEQGLAWASTLQTLASRIAGRPAKCETATAVDDSWKSAIHRLKSQQQRLLAEALRGTTHGLTHYEMLDVPNAFAEPDCKDGPITEGAAKQKCVRISSAWAECPPVPWIIRAIPNTSPARYKAVPIKTPE